MSKELITYKRVELKLNLRDAIESTLVDTSCKVQMIGKQRYFILDTLIEVLYENETSRYLFMGFLYDRDVVSKSVPLTPRTKILVQEETTGEMLFKDPSKFTVKLEVYGRENQCLSEK